MKYVPPSYLGPGMTRMLDACHTHRGWSSVPVRALVHSSKCNTYSPNKFCCRARDRTCRKQVLRTSRGQPVFSSPMRHASSIWGTIPDTPHIQSSSVSEGHGNRLGLGSLQTDPSGQRSSRHATASKPDYQAPPSLSRQRFSCNRPTSQL